MVGGVLSRMVAGFSTEVKDPMSPGRHPTTLTLGIGNSAIPYHVQAMWRGLRGSTVKTDTYSNMSALVIDVVP